MTTIEGFPYFEAEFTKQGQIFPAGATQELLAEVAQTKITDLLVLSHGWNNDKADAKELYNRLLKSLHSVIETVGPQMPNPAQRKIGILGIFWPSKKFAERELIPGGGAAAIGDNDDETTQIEAALDLLASDLDDAQRQTLAEAKQLLGDLEDDVAAQRKFVDKLRSVLPPRDAGEGDAADQFFQLPGDELIEQLSMPIVSDDGDGGGAAGLGNVISSIGNAISDAAAGVKAAARRLANYATYYQMKQRAGTVGAGGVNQLMQQLRDQNPGFKIHLVGHSFGGRLVSAVANGPNQFAPSSMTLLQAAFSHHGFAENFDGQRDGFFRNVVSEHRVHGPIVITHTEKDQAVGTAYAIASRISGVDASALGDANDPYGGIGRNGAVKTAEAIPGHLHDIDQPYDFTDGKLYNLESSQFIDNHGDVTNPQVAHAILSAIAAS